MSDQPVHPFVEPPPSWAISQYHGDPRIIERMRRLDSAPTVSEATLDDSPSPAFRYAITHRGRELVVLTVRDGRLCASYDDDDLDQAARQFLDRVLELNRADLPDDGHEA